jgi:hypothetical protein
MATYIDGELAALDGGGDVAQMLVWSASNLAMLELRA